MKTSKCLMILLASCLSASVFAGGKPCGAFLAQASTAQTIVADGDSDKDNNSDALLSQASTSKTIVADGDSDKDNNSDGLLSLSTAGHTMLAGGKPCGAFLADGDTDGNSSDVLSANTLPVPVVPATDGDQTPDDNSAA